MGAKALLFCGPTQEYLLNYTDVGRLNNMKDSVTLQDKCVKSTMVRFHSVWDDPDNPKQLKVAMTGDGDCTGQSFNWQGSTETCIYAPGLDCIKGVHPIAQRDVTAATSTVARGSK